jgi:hypothetical protein
MTSGDRSPQPDLPGTAAAKAEAVRADLAAIDERVFAGSGAVSLDAQLAALRDVTIRVLGPVDG